MVALRTVDLCKRFRRRTPVLRDISLVIPEGGFLCLLGESGSGKSTLLKIIAGLEQPDRGTIEIAGRDVLRLQPNERDVAYIFQDTDTLFPHLSVAENIKFPIEVGHRKYRGGSQRTLEELYSTLRLHSVLKRSVDRLSGGEKQRVALARSLVYQSSLLLLDEPVSALDNMTKAEFRHLLQNIHDQYKCSMFLVTHDEREAQALGSHIAILDRASIVQAGPSADVVAKPSTPRAALLLGGWCLVTEDATTLTTAVGGLGRHINTMVRHPPRQDHVTTVHTLGLREDRFRVVRNDEECGNDSLTLNGTIRVVQPWYGNERILVKLNPHPVEIACIVHRNNEDLSPGSQVRLAINVGDVSLWEGAPDDWQ